MTYRNLAALILSLFLISTLTPSPIRAQEETTEFNDQALTLPSYDEGKEPDPVPTPSPAPALPEQNAEEETFRDDRDVIPPPPVKLAERTNVTVAQIYRRVSHKVLSVTDQSVTVEVRFQPRIATRFPARLDYRFWAAGPEGAALTGTVLEADWYVVEEELEKTNGPFHLDGDSVWGKPPSNLTQVKTSFVDQVRGVPLHRIEMSLVQGVTNTVSKGSATAWMGRMVIRFDIPDVPSADSSAFNDPYLVDLLSPELINPGHMPRFYKKPQALPREAELTAWNERLRAAEEEGMLLKGKLPRGGVYSLGYDDFERLGFKPENLDLSKLKFFVGQQEVPVLEYDLSRGRLIGDGKLFFAAPFDPEDRTPYRSLWIMQDSKGTPPLRSRHFSNRNRADSITNGLARTVVFAPNVFNHKMPSSAPQLKWASAQMTVGQTYEQEFQMGKLPPDAMIQSRVWYTMFSAGSATGDGNLILSLNGKEIFRKETRGSRLMVETYKVPASAFREGTNLLVAQNLAPERGGTGAMQFIQAEFVAPMTTEGLQPQALLTVTDDVFTSTNLYFPCPESDRRPAVLADVTDPLAPALVRMEPVSRERGFFWYAAPPIPGKDRQYVYTPADSPYHVIQLGRATAPRSFLDREQLDYLIIAHSTLKDALTPLVEKRREKYVTEVYTVEDIYDAFSAGEISYKAIHEAINHSFRSRQAPPLQAVLLVGEGSEYWWEYRRPTVGISPNMVPVYGWKDPGVDIRGDDSYTQLVGKGNLSDVELGRLSTESPTELAAMVDKILRYENSPPPGDWRHRHLFVADDEPEFSEVCRDIVTKTFRGANLPMYMFLQDFPYEDYFRGFWRKRSVTMTDELLRHWADGARTITYLGHGGPNLWSSERILHTRDVENITDGGKHPFLVAGSCDTGWVDYPLDPVRASLSEELTRNPHGGAIAAFIPIDGTSSFEHNYLLTALFESMMVRGERRFGSIAMLGKINYFLPRNNARVPNQYLLMGDPLQEMPEQAGSISMKASPLEFLKGTRGEIDVKGQFPGVQWGVVDVVLLNPDQQVASREKMRLVNSYFEGKVALPLDFTPGTYTLMALAVSDSAGQQGSASVPVEVYDHNISFNWRTDQPTDKPLPAGAPIEVTMEVKNESQLPLSGASLVIEDYLGKETFRAVVEAKPGEVLRQTFKSPVPPGVSTIKGKLFLKDETVFPVAQASLVLLGKHPDGRPFDVVLGDTRVEHLRDSAGFQVVLPIVSLSDEPITLKRIELMADDGETSLSLGERRIASLESGTTREYLFKSDRILPPGPCKFAVRMVEAESRADVFTVPFEFDLGRGPDLEIVPGSLVVENLNPRAGNTVFVRFDAKNIGDRPAYGVDTTLYLNRPWSQTDLAPNSAPWGYSQRIPAMMPGEQRTFRERWDPTGAIASSVTLYPAIEAIGSEANIENNTTALPLQLLGATNLAIDNSGVKVSHTTVQPYDRVRFSVPFRNTSDRDFLQEFRVTAVAEGMNGLSRRLISTRFSSLAAGESATFQFDWLCLPGENSVTVNVNADREYLETSYSDNERVFAFPFAFPVEAIVTPEGGYNFASVIEFGTERDLLRLPTGDHQLVKSPRGIRNEVGFKPEYIVEGPFSTEPTNDGMVEILNGEALRNDLGEEVVPVKFRIPMDPDDGTTLYDVELRLMPKGTNPRRLSGVFRYRFGDDPDWHIEDRPRGQSGRYGLIDTIDDNLIFSFGTTESQSSNHLFGFTLYPVTGELTSAYIRTREPITGVLTVDANTPGRSRVDVFVRHGKGTNESITWSDWKPAAAGMPVPPMPSDTTYFQWKARLVATKEDRPTLRNIIIGEKSSAAPVSISQEVRR
ncbi:hypothetical protein GC173_17950 [bacterium]|nr:hypothetical protein [bacterium]